MLLKTSIQKKEESVISLVTCVASIVSSGVGQTGKEASTLLAGMDYLCFTTILLNPLTDIRHTFDKKMIVVR